MTLQCSVPPGKGGVDLCWDKFEQGVHRDFRWLFLACSSCHFSSSSHHKHIAFLVLGALWSLPVFPRVRKRREKSRQWEKRKTGRCGYLEQQIEHQIAPGVLGILLTSARSQLHAHNSHFLSVDSVYTGGKSRWGGLDSASVSRLWSNYSKWGKVRERRKWKKRRKCRAGGWVFWKKGGEENKECCHKIKRKTTEMHKVFFSEL